MAGPVDVSTLAARLRTLRRGWPFAPRLTQPEVASALGVSTPSISSWEKGKSLPPPHRLTGYARMFGAPRITDKGRPRMALDDDMTNPEMLAFQALERELGELRRAALTALDPRSPRPEPPPAAASAHPWRFPAGQAVTIVCSELDDAHRAQLPYADPRDPNHIASYRYADIDALIELYGHVKGLNPNSGVHIRTYPELTDEDRASHLIVLGGIDFNPLAADLLPYLSHVPVSQLPRDDDDDPGSFLARAGSGDQRFRPRFSHRPPGTTLREDVALFLRTPNPYAEDRTAFLCNGMYARGTYGMVRALTDSKVAGRNTEYLSARFAGDQTYSILSRVRVVANKVVVPDWTLDDIRLYEWPEVGA
ncbi:helix-turn-helix domain-containing protein [Mangrovihabitans endophyticus]|uniref:HTH cro/C1-type domain-containing protein n=1 Tax=Mangrovihabitans endophyticus TaxID=1751298 RepID=A0A8J3BRX9_9ACTN|nr:helix-turn-helix transcriptional regulator [Mangrovihabitans endophyticus]GGK72100.1 hypothetical protein GCM10012284_02390 [Mangrovihabitans endophyticus]